MAGHRYWKLILGRSQANSNGFIGLSQLQVFESGVDQLSSATLTTSVTLQAGALTDLYSGSPSTSLAQWTYNITTTTIPDILMDFGSGVTKDLTSFKIWPNKDAAGRTPALWYLMYSDDGVNYTLAFAVWEATTYVAGTPVQYTYPSLSGAQRYWGMLLPTPNASSAGAVSFAEIQLRNTSGGSDLTGSGTASATDFFDSSTNPPKAVDNNAATLWSSSGPKFHAWFYDFGSGNSYFISEVVLQARASSNFDQTPLSFYACSSSDGTVYQPNFFFSDNTAWTSNATKTFTGVTAINTDVIYDYAIQLKNDLILDYALTSYILTDLVITYAIQLRRSLILDYAIPSEGFSFFDWRPDKVTNIELESDYELTCTPIDVGLFAVPGDRLILDHVVNPDAQAFFINEFYGDFYLRIWLDPQLRSLSNPLINSPIPFNIWNAYPSENQLIEIVVTDLPGVTFNFTLPVDFLRYEYKTLTFSIGNDAPAEINGYADFIFDQGQAQLHLIATVIGIMKALPNEPIEETWQWATALNISKSSKEQRAGLRYRPRHLMSYPTFIEGDEGRSQYYRQLWTFLSRSIRVPMFQYAVELDADASAGDTKLYFDPTKTDMRDDDYIVIYNPVDDSLMLTKPTTIDVDGATLENPLEVDVGSICKVMPTINMRLAPASGLSMDSVNGTATINAESVTGRDLLRPGSDPTITTFDGLVVIPDEPVITNAGDENFDQNTETIDNGTVNPVPYTFWPMPFVSGPKQWLIDREVDLPYWQKIGVQLNGSRNPFLMPTWRKDLTLYETPSLGSSTIRVLETDYPNMVTNDAYSRLQIRTANGVEYHTVTSAIDSGLGYVDVVLGEGIGVDEGDNVIDRISFLNRCRLVDDKIRLLHYQGYSLVELNYRTINE